MIEAAFARPIHTFEELKQAILSYNTRLEYETFA
jgi:hypothetical protein